MHHPVHFLHLNGSTKPNYHDHKLFQCSTYTFPRVPCFDSGTHNLIRHKVCIQTSFPSQSTFSASEMTNCQKLKGKYRPTSPTYPKERSMSYQFSITTIQFLFFTTLETTILIFPYSSFTLQNSVTRHHDISSVFITQFIFLDAINQLLT